jgi:hypothetical protein
VAAGLDRFWVGQQRSARAENRVGRQPAGLPSRQFAWNAELGRDIYGNPISPRHQRLLLMDVEGRPTADSRNVLEAALRTLERRFPWSPAGLLFTVGWGPRYFEDVLGTTSPIPGPVRLSDSEAPILDDYQVCIHLACDDEARLQAVERALLHGGALHGTDGTIDLRGILRLRETRTGFAGAGLPKAHQQDRGIPAGASVPAHAPLFMGFKSGLLRNQATEGDVAIPSGTFAQGTTMQLSYIHLELDSWYQNLTKPERVARMYAPEVTVAQASRFTTDAESSPRQFAKSVDQYGVVGHAQATARARRHGRPVILRRDFDTVDGNQAGVHFISLQRTIADFVRTRTAMNATAAEKQNPAITSTANNGINEFMFVIRRANYVIPSRAARSFPLLAS